MRRPHLIGRRTGGESCLVNAGELVKGASDHDVGVWDSLNPTAVHRLVISNALGCFTAMPKLLDNRFVPERIHFLPVTMMPVDCELIMLDQAREQLVFLAGAVTDTLTKSTQAE
jgi:hypothetical protein